jgi:hypothetical protein
MEWLLCSIQFSYTMYRSGFCRINLCNRILQSLNTADCSDLAKKGEVIVYTGTIAKATLCQRTALEQLVQSAVYNYTKRYLLWLSSVVCAYYTMYSLHSQAYSDQISRCTVLCKLVIFHVQSWNALSYPPTLPILEGLSLY